MGISANSFQLYTDLANAGHFANVDRVMELGSQVVDAVGREDLFSQLLTTLGQPLPSDRAMTKLVNGPAREFYQALGIAYNCLDTDGRHNALLIDLNFDRVPSEHRERYPLVTNHGTTEHVFNQYNAFKVIHDLTCLGGLMLHIVPLDGIAYRNHCFYTYQPDFFVSLARSNAYELCGMWASLGGDNGGILVPCDSWKGDTDSFPVFTNSSVLLIAVLKKKYPDEFLVPYQTIYERSRTPQAAARYSYNVAGRVVDGNTAAATDDAEMALTLSL